MLKKKTEIERTRAEYSYEMRRPCPGCGQPIRRGELIIIEKIWTGKTKKLSRWDIEYGSRAYRDAGVKPEIKTRYWHKDCWFEAQGAKDWWHPGIMAEDIEEEELLDMGHPLPADYKFTPIVELPKKKSFWDRLRRRNAMVKRRRYHNPVIDDGEGTEGYSPPAFTPSADVEPEIEDISEPAALPPSPTLPAPVQISERSGSVVRRKPARTGPMKFAGMKLTTWLIILGAAGATGTGIYWFFFRHKYHIGDILQYEGSQYQVSGLKFSGVTRFYTMIKDYTETVEFPVKDVDSDPAWIQVS